MFAAGKTKGAVATAANYIEDVFSTYLYSGTGSAQTITNNIDLSTNGGLVWIKERTSTSGHIWTDTARGVYNYIQSDNNNAQISNVNTLTAFNTNGFAVGNSGATSESGQTYVSWTFRKQPKFYTQGTFTGDGTYNRVLSHDLGSVPACIIVKATSGSNDWMVWTKKSSGSFGSDSYVGLYLNQTAASIGEVSGTTNLGLTSTTFNIGKINLYDNYNASNTNGVSYVYYMFAHNAGGFGLTGTDNVISCGSFTVGGSGAGQVNLGYEAQWVLTKNTAAGGAWNIVDTMRGLTVDTGYEQLLANSSGAAVNWTTPYLSVNNQGFGYSNQTSGDTWIYIAIRRGPMKVPTDATKVFSNNATTGSTGTAITTNFPVDLYVWQNRDGTYSNVWQDRLRGIPNTDTTGVTLTSQSTLAEQSGGYNGAYQPWNTGLRINSGASGANSIYWNFRRAPSFFDEVCYTGTGSATTFAHNLGVVPELIIVKSRSGGIYDWRAYNSTIGAENYLTPNAATGSGASSTTWNNTAPTSSVFTVGTSVVVNGSGATFVAYLFATCAGVSKVGSYTGNGTTQTINCGFTGGARFVLIKRTDSTGDWYVYDTARGMTTLTDPYLLLNSTAAETATLGSVTTVSTGFAVNAAILAAINTNGASYIYLSIA